MQTNYFDGKQGQTCNHVFNWCSRKSLPFYGNLWIFRCFGEFRFGTVYVFYWPRMLPNPFNNNSLPKPSFNSHTTSTTSASVTTLNPGPGLPQAAPVSYSNYVPRLQPAIKKTFGFGRGGSYSSGSQQFLPFSCDRCDRSFKSKELLDQHISEHIPCGINGCKFVAHPKIVEKHIQMQHETGLAEQIMRLTTPEEIEKWRAERKR